MPEIVMLFAEIVFWPFRAVIPEDSAWRPVVEFCATFAAYGASVGHIRHDDRERFYLMFGQIGSNDVSGDEVRAAPGISCFAVLADPEEVFCA